MKKTNISYVTFGIIILLLLSTLLSYAYFSANIHDSETDTTITASGGTMDIYFIYGSNNIVENNMSPSDTPFADKEFTIKGNNTINKTMNYNLNLVVKTNSFSDYALSYNLSLKSKTGSGTPVLDSEEDMCYLLNGAQTEVLGSGKFLGPTNGDETHTYNLKMYFPDKEIPQNEDKGKTFAAYIKTEEGEKAASECKQIPIPIGDVILADNGGAENITEAPTSLFNSINTEDENKMYKMEDDYGDSYYFRGAKTYVNNNLIFANHQWKIIRINGDGSLRIIYNGECTENSCTINSTGAGTSMMLPSDNSLYHSGGYSSYNLTNYNDNKYLGYMYGGANGVASTSRLQATTNETDARIKSYLDSWYIVNISETDYENYISDTLFCNDRQLYSEVGGSATGTGFGTDTTHYAAYYRLYIKKTPNLKCANTNDRFTTTNYNNVIVPGNKSSDYPIGLLTAEEGSLAGLKNATSNSTNYLYTGRTYWTMSPSHFDDSRAYVWRVDSWGSLDSSRVNAWYDVRGVLNLASNTPITGTGTTLDPYVVLD